MITSPNDYMNEVKAKGHVVGTWGFNSNMDFSRIGPEETNVWFFEQTFNFLRAFFGLVMPDNMEVITYNATKHIKKDKLDQQTFLDELMLIMKGLKEPIWTLRLNLNIVGFIRSHVDPDNPVRVQMQEPSSLLVWGGPDESGFQNFSISYNLFNESELAGSDEMLWSVNQPLLEKGLRKWEMQTGHTIEAVSGNTAGRGGVTQRYGFQRPPAGLKRRRPLPRRPGGPQQTGVAPGVPGAQAGAAVPPGVQPGMPARPPVPPPPVAPRPPQPVGPRLPVPPRPPSAKSK